MCRKKGSLLWVKYVITSLWFYWYSWAGCHSQWWQLAKKKWKRINKKEIFFRFTCHQLWKQQQQKKELWQLYWSQQNVNGRAYLIETLWNIVELVPYINCYTCKMWFITCGQLTINDSDWKTKVGRGQPVFYDPTYRLSYRRLFT